MTPQELRSRIDRFADTIIALCRSLPEDRSAARMASQLQDAGTSVGANYRAACRAQTRRVFIAKLSVALEEADESVYWLGRLSKAGLGDSRAVEAALQEANEIAAILNASRRTAGSR